MWNKPQLLNALADLLFLAAAAALLAAGAVWLVRMPALPITEVAFVDALTYTRRGEIEQVLPPTLQGNFFSLNLGAVRHGLLKLPWARRVAVRRVWPNRLEIRLEEHRPVATWGGRMPPGQEALVDAASGVGALVNSYGEVFVAPLAAPETQAMPLLEGPQGTSAEVLKRYGELSTLFATVDETLVRVSLSSRLAWQLELKSGLALKLGREQPKAPLHERLARFIEIYPEVIPRRRASVAAVDLRYPNGFALQARSESK